jgi:DNA-binding response OmpR family regulator
VLVVDDSEVIRTLIAVNLELEGFEVIQAFRRARTRWRRSSTCVRTS